MLGFRWINVNNWGTKVWNRYRLLVLTHVVFHLNWQMKIKISMKPISVYYITKFEIKWGSNLFLTTNLTSLNFERCHALRRFDRSIPYLSLTHKHTHTHPVSLSLSVCLSLSSFLVHTHTYTHTHTSTHTHTHTLPLSPSLSICLPVSLFISLTHIQMHTHTHTHSHEHTRTKWFSFVAFKLLLQMRRNSILETIREKLLVSNRVLYPSHGVHHRRSKINKLLTCFKTVPYILYQRTLKRMKQALIVILRIH